MYPVKSLIGRVLISRTQRAVAIECLLPARRSFVVPKAAPARVAEVRACLRGQKKRVSGPSRPAVRGVLFESVTAPLVPAPDLRLVPSQAGSGNEHGPCHSPRSSKEDSSPLAAFSKTSRTAKVVGRANTASGRQRMEDERCPQINRDNPGAFQENDRISGGAERVAKRIQVRNNTVSHGGTPVRTERVGRSPEGCWPPPDH